MIDVADLLIQRGDLETVFSLCLTSNEMRSYCDLKCKLIDVRYDTIFECYREWKTPLLIKDDSYAFSDCVLVNSKKMLELLLANAKHKLQLEAKKYRRSASEILGCVLIDMTHLNLRAQLYAATYSELKEIFWLDPRGFTAKDFPMLQLDEDFLLNVVKSDPSLKHTLRVETGRKIAMTKKMYNKGRRVLRELR